MSFNPQEVTKNEYELPEEGSYSARLARVIEIGTQTDKFGSKKKVVLGFTVPDLDPIVVDGVEKQRMMWTSKFGINQTSNPDGTLMKYVNAMKSDATHMKQMLNAPCIIEIKHTDPKPDGSQFADIKNVSKPMKGMVIPECDCDVFMFEFDKPDKEIWDKLSEPRQEHIKKADDAAEMLAKMEGNVVQTTSDTDDFDDDIPF